MKVAIHEFRAHLSEYVRKAQAGQTIELTSHRKTVARIVGVPQAVQVPLTRLVASGVASWRGGKPAGASLSLQDRGTPVSRMVIEDRG